MTDTEIAQARAALRTAVSNDPEVLVAVGRGLLGVPTEAESPQVAPVTTGGYPELAVRRRDS